MFYLITIIVSIILWIWFFYIKSPREYKYNGEPLKAPMWLYLIGFGFLFIPFLNFGFPFILTLCMIFDKDVKLKNGKQSIGEKIKNILNKEF